MEGVLEMAHHIFLLGFFSLTCSLVLASNPSPLQDFCVAKRNSEVLVNGLACEDPKLVQAQDFFFMGLHKPGNTSNPFGTAVAPVFVDQLPGLNTLGISMGRVEYAPWGVIPPHIHPRASEIITVLDGAIDMGFITSNPENRLISKTLHKGDVFVFPQGLVHFQRNVGPGNAVTLSALSSPSPGVITVANAVFGSSGPIPADVLTKAFQVDKKTVDYLQAHFYLN